MKISYTVEQCRDRVSPQCTGTFHREIKRGRPQVNCEFCKAFKAPTARVAAAKKSDEPIDTKRECPCGAEFHIKLGRGRKASKCDECRANGVVYRADEDGELQAIRAETLAQEQREKDEQAGKERAERLVMMMRPLLLKTDRQVIMH